MVPQDSLFPITAHTIYIILTDDIAYYTIKPACGVDLVKNDSDGEHMVAIWSIGILAVSNTWLNHLIILQMFRKVMPDVVICPVPLIPYPSAQTSANLPSCMHMPCLDVILGVAYHAVKLLLKTHYPTRFEKDR